VLYIYTVKIKTSSDIEIVLDTRMCKYITITLRKYELPTKQMGVKTNRTLFYVEIISYTSAHPSRAHEFVPVFYMY
jgi:hypothetical protein